MKAFLLLAGLLGPLLLRAQSPTTLRIRGNLVGSTKPYYFIKGVISRRLDTLWVKPDGSFDKTLIDWPGLEEVSIIGQNLYTDQWFAPGFDLTYSISVSPKLEPLERYKQNTVAGPGSILNRYEWDEALLNRYSDLHHQTLTAAQAQVGVTRVRTRLDSLWQARFPKQVTHRLTTELPVFEEFAHLKENERLFAYFRHWSSISSDTAAINQQFFAPEVYKKLREPINTKCYECLLEAEYYVSKRLQKVRPPGENAFYILQLPEYERLFPKPVADAMMRDIFPEIVANYEYEASPTPTEIIALIDRYYPKNAEVGKGKLLNQLSQLQIRKKATHEEFIVNAKAPAFQAVDSTGRVYTLDAFKGKVIYIDFWASWCGPCRAEMPFVKRLREKYTDNPNVVFINLAVHDLEGNWKKALRVEHPTGLALWDKMGAANKAYKANFIPRYVLIGKNGELLDAYEPGPRMSEANAQSAIERALLAEYKSK